MDVMDLFCSLLLKYLLSSVLLVLVTGERCKGRWLVGCDGSLGNGDVSSGRATERSGVNSVRGATRCAVASATMSA